MGSDKAMKDGAGKSANSTQFDSEQLGVQKLMNNKTEMDATNSRLKGTKRKSEEHKLSFAKDRVQRDGHMWAHQLLHGSVY